MCWVSGAAARNNAPDAAEDAARRASGAAALIPESTYLGFPFGATKVAMRRLENAVLADNYGRAASLVDQIPAAGLSERKTRSRHLLDIANVNAELNQCDRALATMTRLRAESPRWLRLQPYAIDITTKLVHSRKRAIPGELRELADFMHVGA